MNLVKYLGKTLFESTLATVCCVVGMVGFVQLNEIIDDYRDSKKNNK